MACQPEQTGNEFRPLEHDAIHSDSLIFLLIAFWILIGHKRLVTQGELSIGKVTNVRLRRRGPEVTYEFVDHSGRLITASSPDDTRSFSPGMAIPIFYNTESPETDQVALC